MGSFFNISIFPGVIRIFHSLQIFHERDATLPFFLETGAAFLFSFLLPP